MASKKTKPIVKFSEEILSPEIEEPVAEELEDKSESEVTVTEMEKSVKVPKKFLIVTAENLNVRKEASKESEILTVVSKNEKLEMNDKKLIKGFYSVRTVSGINGYVMKEFVEVK